MRRSGKVREVMVNRARHRGCEPKPNCGVLEMFHLHTQGRQGNYNFTAAARPLLISLDSVAVTDLDRVR